MTNYISDPKLKGQLDFIVEADKMKSVLRRTMLVDYSRRENDAEHSWHLALVLMTLKDHAAHPFDMERALKMAIVHDLVEVYAGDTFAFDQEGYKDKEDREERAAEKLFSLLPQEQGEEFYSLWKEFDECESDDSKVANAADHLQPFISNYETKGHTWRVGDVRRSQVEKRMAIAYEVFPALAGYLDGVIEEAVSKGWILEG